MKIKKINVTDIEGFKIGNAENIDKATGCTVIVCEEGAVGGVDVRGGGPATRETDLLKSENTVESINAVVLSGGSAFGLEAASGVMNELSDKGIGFKVGEVSVPIVCGASLFDLAVGDSRSYPDKEMGRQACKNAYEGVFSEGNRGAGTGASVGKLLGMERAMKSGLGTFACGDDYIQVGAVVAVNAIGDVYNGAGNIIAGLRTEDGSKIYGTIKTLKTMVHNGDTSSEDEKPKNKHEFSIIGDEKRKTKSEIADAIRNAFTKKPIHEENEEMQSENSTVSEISSVDITPSESTDNTNIDMYLLQDTNTDNNKPVEHDSESITDTVTGSAFTSAETAPTASESEVEVEEYLDFSEYESIDTADTDTSETEKDLGYDISFNTTIACLITNAKMTKSQCNKLASVLHDAYARAIKPVHSTLDGDTIFVLTTAEHEVNFDAFSALATDVLQYAIIDAATSSEGAYGLPSARDIIG